MRKKKKGVKVKVIVGALAIVLSLILIFKLIIPFAFNMLEMLFILLQVFIVLPLEYKFIGGCFFLVVFWYIFVAIVNVTSKICMWGIKQIQEEI